MRLILLVLALFGVVVPTALAEPVAVAVPVSVSVSARPITQFKIGSSEQNFGALTFVGGLEMTGRGDFGAFSGFRYREPGGSFVAVTDTGFWAFGRIARDQQGRPAGFADFSMEPMVGPDGQATNEKWFVDAEGLALQDDTAIVGFERVHRLSRYDLNPGMMGRQTENLDFLVPARELRENRGFETVMTAPRDGPFAGAIVAVTEKSLDPKGDIFGAVLSGPRKGIFTVARSGGFDITDGAFLPDGDVLLLERRFTMATGVAMRLRLVPSDDIAAGRRAEGQIILSANMAYQIDNMEGMDAWLHADGSIRIALVSDDNLSILQRNLYLEFIYHGSADVTQ